MVCFSYDLETEMRRIDESEEFIPEHSETSAQSAQLLIDGRISCIRDELFSGNADATEVQLTKLVDYLSFEYNTKGQQDLVRSYLPLVRRFEKGLINKIKNKSIEEILKEDPDIKIIPAEEWDLPKIDYYRFKKEKGEDAKLMIDILKRFLIGPYIIDNFQNHEERIEWRRDMEGVYITFNTYYQTNCLKGTKLHQVTGAVNAIIESLYIGKDEELNRLGAQIKQKPGFMREYESKKGEERIEHMKDLKQKVYSFLQYLTKPSTEQNLPQ